MVAGRGARQPARQVNEANNQPICSRPSSAGRSRPSTRWLPYRPPQYARERPIPSNPTPVEPRVVVEPHEGPPPSLCTRSCMPRDVLGARGSCVFDARSKWSIYLCAQGWATMPTSIPGRSRPSIQICQMYEAVTASCNYPSTYLHAPYLVQVCEPLLTTSPTWGKSSS